MTEKEILELIEGCGCRECGAIYGYEEHEQTQKQTAKKIFNAMQVTLGLPSVIGRLESIDRYELNETWGNELEEHILTDGDWVKWEDIEAIVKDNAL